MDFKTYYQQLPPAEREAFAKKVGTSVGYCHQIAYGHKRIELGLADAIVAAASQQIGLDDLPLTDRAKHQRKARGWDGKERTQATPRKSDKPKARA